MTVPAELARRAAAVQLLVTDVDGVWTDGSILVQPDGEALLRFSVQDGYGLKQLMAAGVEVAAISGRTSAAFSARARELGIASVVLGCSRKGPEMARMAAERGLQPDQVAAIGDDLPDLELFDIAGLAFAPSNAVEAVRQSADVVTERSGGAGALREVCELLLAARGRPLSPPAGAAKGRPAR